MSFDNLQNEIYAALASLAIAALNPGWSYDPVAEKWTDGTLVQNAPPIPVIQDMQDEGAPTTSGYVTIQQTPTLDRIGLGPNSTQQDSTGLRTRNQPYTAEVKLEETNSPGNFLVRIRDFSDTEEGMAILDATNVGILDFGEIKEFSMVLDGRWFTQIQSQVTVTISSSTPETLSYINTMNATGTLN